MAKNIEKLLVKFFTDSATPADLEILTEWVKDPKNRVLFQNFVETHVAINYNINAAKAQNAVEDFLKIIRKEKTLVYRIKRNPIYKLAIAASVLIIVTLSLFLNSVNDSESQIIAPVIVNNQIESGTDKATLTLEDGSQIILEKGTSFQTQNIDSDGEQLVYEADVDNEEDVELVYNYLTIPRGGQFSINLSDGTKVWLNSETQLKYPKTFIEGQTRQVELLYGEIYLSVSPSSAHNGDKFKVKTKFQEVEVLGTEFNIKAYQDEHHVYTTLVEGKVSVSNAHDKMLLNPSEQSIVGTDKGFQKRNDINVHDIISWRKGVFSFNGKPLKEIMKVLSRWYDMDVIFENEDIKNTKFIGVLGKEQEIEDILNSILGSGFINSYQIKDKTVRLK
ncbi:FecR family protein [Maribacter sp. 2304DJ31-5]|uniref:FecR family protein n=1 Tax=Maribacter sp. 2304DJ31-5 TaxID=3386273 RepID=UPI0039BD2F7C